MGLCLPYLITAVAVCLAQYSVVIVHGIEVRRRSIQFIITNLYRPYTENSRCVRVDVITYCYNRIFFMWSFAIIHTSIIDLTTALSDWTSWLNISASCIYRKWHEWALACSSSQSAESLEQNTFLFYQNQKFNKVVASNLDAKYYMYLYVNWHCLIRTMSETCLRTKCLLLHWDDVLAHENNFKNSYLNLIYGHVIRVSRDIICHVWLVAIILVEWVLCLK